MKARWGHSWPPQDRGYDGVTISCHVHAPSFEGRYFALLQNSPRFGALVLLSRIGASLLSTFANIPCEIRPGPLGCVGVLTSNYRRYAGGGRYPCNERRRVEHRRSEHA